METTVHLNPEKHALEMMSMLKQMRQDNIHCDLKIEVEDDVYYTHKSIMTAGSEYFRAMLRHDTRELREGRVVFRDVDSECVKKCIDFIYSARLDIPNGKITDLLHVAVMMQLDDVKWAISDIFAKSITVENYFSIKYAADMYALDDITHKCDQVLEENIIEISNQSEFGDIEKSALLGLLKSKNLKMCGEDKLTLSLNWIEKNPDKTGILPECLEMVDLDEMSVAFLQHLLETPPISNDFVLYKLINGHLNKTLLRSLRKKDNEDNVDKMLILFDSQADRLRSFDIETEEVTELHGENFKKFMNFSTVCLGSYIYLLGSNQSVNRLNFQKRCSKWEKMKDMIFNHGLLPPSVSLSGSIFIIGGSLEGTTIVERFDPYANEWFELENQTAEIYNTTLVTLNDSVYCVGGISEGVAVSSFRRFIPSASEWFDLEPIRYPVHGCGTVAFGQRIFVIGGWNDTTKLNNVECYDVASSNWTSLSSMNSCHGLNNAYRVGNWIVSVDHLETSDHIEKYDIMNNRWYKIRAKVDECFELYGSTMVTL